MREDAFANTCLRMEAAYTAIRQARPVSRGLASHASVVQQVEVIWVCRHHLISDVGERRVYRFEQLVKAQVLEDELASDDILTHSHLNPDACSPLAASSWIHLYVSFL